MAGQHTGEDSSTFDEEAVRKLLAGSEEDIGRALACIHVYLCGSLSCWLRRQFPGADPDDLEDAWSETLLDVLQAARRKRFQSDRSLWPWLIQIARARAIDHTRREASRERAYANVRFVLTRSERLVPSSHDAAVAAETNVLIHHLIHALPSRQRTVLEVFFDHYPESTCLRTLHREVALATGEQVSRIAVKRAFQEGRIRLRRALRHAGYASASTAHAWREARKNP